jgi:hypothetical protein
MSATEAARSRRAKYSLVLKNNTVVLGLRVRSQQVLPALWIFLSRKLAAFRPEVFYDFTD